MTLRKCLPLLLLPLLAACSYEKVTPPLARGTDAGSNITEAEARELLAEHNRIRAEVGSAPLQWSPRLARIAQNWAENLGQSCRMSHNPDTGYGENLFMATAYHYTPADAPRSWAKEKSSYQGGVLTKDNWFGSGHYTQMVWSRTRTMGCGVTECGGQMMILVCNYDPAGNVLGQAPY